MKRSSMAPEFDNEICYSALTSDTTIGIYRYLNAGDPYAVQFATIRVPEGQPLKYISSVEIIQTSLDRFDTTYFAFRGAKMHAPLTALNSAIWIDSLGADPDRRWVRRVDDGAITGDTAYRVEPEWLVGQDEAFLYYNVYMYGGIIKELRRCRTGIFLNPVGLKEQQPATLKIFPNPVSYELTISNLPPDFRGQLVLYSISGQEVFRHFISESHHNYNVKGLSPGIYILKVGNDHHTFLHKVAIK